jgi:ligand-binding sensor domain-containing protein
LKANYTILALLICFVQPAAAQSPDYHIQVIKGSNILNSNQVEQIMRDKKGFLWLLSPSRVQRFDGKNFKTYSFDDRCGSIEQDASGNIWVLARNHIYVRWNDRDEFEDKTPSADPSARYRRLLAGPGGNLFLLTNTGISNWSSQQRGFQPSRIPAYTSRESFPILKSFGNYLFYAHSDKLFRYNVTTGLQDSVACKQANYLFPINQDSVWVREGIGKSALVSFVSATVSPISHEQFDEKYDNDIFFVTGAFRSAPGEFFVSILNKGYFIYNARLNRFKKATLYYKGNPLTENYSINGFYQDNDGTVWFPHSDGLAYFKPFVPGFGLLRSNAMHGDREWNNEVRSITEDDKGNIWFATANGFCRWNKNTGRVRSWIPGAEKNNYLSYGSVRSIGYDNGKIIVGQSENGFWIFDPARETFTRPFFENESSRQKFLNDFNNNMVRLKNGNFLVLSRNLWLIEKGTYRVKEIIFEGSTGGKRNVLEDAANRLWFATDAGIVITDSNFQNPIHLKNTSTGRWLNSIVQIDAETFWVSAKALYEIKIRGNKADTRPLFPALQAELFSNLFKDSLGHIWMNSTEGIYRYIPSRQSLEKFDFSDNVHGSISTVCNEFRSSDGTVYFGTVNGINFFVPEKIPLQNDSLEVHLLNVTVNEDDSSFLQNGTLPTLDHAQNSLVFDFISPYLYNAEKVQYRYRLQGTGDYWVNIGNTNSVRFTSLKPGRYIFQVAASLNSKDWFQAGAGFSFVINPPFWQTWWFLGLVAALTVTGIYTWIYSLRQRIRSEKILNQYATSLYGQNTIEDIFWDTAKNCVEKLGLVDCVIYQKEEARNVLVQKAAFGPKNPYDREILIPLEIPVGKGIVGTVAQTGKAELVGNTARDRRYIVDDEVRLS